MAEKQDKTFGKRKRINNSRNITDYEFAQEKKRRMGGRQDVNEMKRVRELEKKIANSKEIKFKTTAATTVMVVAGTVNMLTNIPGDVTNLGRIGDKIKLYSINCSGILESQSSAVDSFRVRLAMVIDRQQTGTVPTFAEIWGSAAAFARNEPRLADSWRYKRFTIIYDEFFIGMASAGVAAAFGDIKVKIHKWYSQQYKHYIYYLDENSSQAAQRAGNIYLFQAPSATSEVNLSFSVTVKYTDG